MVNTSLFTGLSGLRAHQRYIDVIGNNLANVSTSGFRGSRATFGDLLSFTVRSGSGPTGNFGGLNPQQIGLGSNISSIDTDTSQGTFTDTGRPFDVAMQGRGFFTLTDGNQNYYTRVGTLGRDASNSLVDLRTGLRVVSSSGGNISVPQSGIQPAQPTSRVSFQGALPAEVTGPLSEIVESSSAFLEGAAASRTTSSNAAPNYDLTGVAGNTVLVSVNGGSQQSFTIPNAPPYNAGPVTVAEIEDLFDGTVGGTPISGITLTAVGNALQFDTVSLGESATLKFDDGPGSAGTLAALGLAATQIRGTQQAATSTTDLANLASRDPQAGAYADGDQISISGTNPDGSSFSDTFIYGAAHNGTTIQELIDFIEGNGANPGVIDPNQASLTLAADGTLRLSSDSTGEATLSFFIGDASGNGGGNNFPSFTVSQAGTGPDEAITSIDVIDSQGRTHPITMTFTRSAVDSTVWDMAATMPASSGSINQGSVGTIRFNDDGSFNVIGGGNNALNFTFSGIGSTQSVTIDLGTSGAFDGVTLLGNSTTIAAIDQDGYGPGELLDVAFDQEGNLAAFYSNGQREVLSQLRISMFPNEAALLRAGDTLYTESPNSDNAIATTAGSAGSGSVRPGSLENSNVDIAAEFVNLIEAQRGFQANSRVITTTDEILAELVNIVR